MTSRNNLYQIFKSLKFPWKLLCHRAPVLYGKLQAKTTKELSPQAPVSGITRRAACALLRHGEVSQGRFNKKRYFYCWLRAFVSETVIFPCVCIEVGTQWVLDRLDSTASVPPPATSPTVLVPQRCKPQQSTKAVPSPKKARSNPANLCKHQQSTKVWALKRSIVAPTNPCISVSYLVSLSLSWSFRPYKTQHAFLPFFRTVSLKWEGYHNIWDHPIGLGFQEKRSPAQMKSKSRSFSLTSCLSLAKAASSVQYGERLTRTVGLWLAGLLKQAAAWTLWSTQKRGGKMSCRLEGKYLQTVYASKD